MLPKVKKMKQLVQAKAASNAAQVSPSINYGLSQVSPSGDYVDEGMHASIYNNLGNRPQQPAFSPMELSQPVSQPSPMLDFLQQGPPPEVLDVPATREELINLFVHPDFVPSNNPDVRDLQLDQDLSEDEAIMMLKRRMR